MVSDFVTAVFFLTVVYVLVRPRSRAVDLVKSFSDAVTAMVRAAVDL